MASLSQIFIKGGDRIALLDEKPRILAALSDIPGIARVSPAWPQAWGELPCAVVSEAANRLAARYDGDEHLTELVYYVRLFAERASELATLGSAIDQTMRALGYSRLLCFEDDSAAVRQRVMRYHTYR